MSNNASGIVRRAIFPVMTSFEVVNDVIPDIILCFSIDIIESCPHTNFYQKVATQTVVMAKCLKQQLSFSLSGTRQKRCHGNHAWCRILVYASERSQIVFRKSQKVSVLQLYSFWSNQGKCVRGGTLCPPGLDRVKRRE